MANSVYQDQTAPIGAVCSWFTLFASILNLSVMLGNYLQQTTSADDIFRCIFLGALRVKSVYASENKVEIYWTSLCSDQSESLLSKVAIEDLLSYILIIHFWIKRI